jgi:hypothetical protein
VQIAIIALQIINAAIFEKKLLSYNKGSFPDLCCRVEGTLMQNPFPAKPVYNNTKLIL